MSKRKAKSLNFFLKLIYGGSIKVWGSIKGRVIRAIRAHPSILRLGRELRFKLWLLLIKLRSDNYLEANKIIWVNPENIRYVALELEPLFNLGRVIGGDWDKSTEKFEDLDYKSFRRRFIYGSEWHKTYFYKHILSALEKGKVLWGCRTKAELDDRMKKIDNLYYEMKTHGYRSNKDIRKDKNKLFYDPLDFEEEVTVNIGRDGDLFFNDGRHRLSIAKILKIPKIPVKVTVRHTEWMKFRKKIIASRRIGDKVYQQLTHPDLQDIPVDYDKFHFDLIKKNLSIKKGTVLDIGANLGYLCCRFEEEGFDCYAVENNIVNIYLLKKIKKIEKKRFKIIHQSIFDYKRSRDLSFDIVLALNIFHHFLKTREFYEEFITLLKRIKTREMIFQAHKYDEPQMRGAYKNLHADEFANFILKFTNLTKYKLIGETKDKRKIYKLSNY